MKFLQFPGIVTRRSTDFRVAIPSDQPIAGYCYPDVGKFPGNDTRRLADRRVSLLGNQYEKTLFCEYLHKNENIFEIVLGG